MALPFRPTRASFLLLAVALSAVAATIVLVKVHARWPAVPRTNGEMHHEAYVWQRAWDDDIRQAITRAAPSMSGLVVLAAEVSWEASPQTARVRPDYDSLRSCGVPVGLALRIGPLRGGSAEYGRRAPFLADLAASLVDEARSAGVDVREMQIDFDCPESKLGCFRGWVEAIRERCAPVPVTITALPCWLGERAFRRLAETADGYVLQVHSLDPPRGPDEPFTLCDTAAARRWIEEAGRLGMPFTVALPTYGYLVAFDSSGRFVGLAAEGSTGGWAPRTVVTTVESDPSEIAALVRDLRTDRPACMAGIAWYRLPVEGDVLNWHWKTLAAVMRGRPPASGLAVELERPAAGLVDVYLANGGETRVPAAVVRLGWRTGDLLASDGLSGFDLAAEAPGGIVCRRGPRAGFGGIAPGERRHIAWLRFDAPTEVKADVETSEK